MSALIRCEHIYKSYRERPRGIKSMLLGKIKAPSSRFARDWALQDLSFEVARGSAFGIIGHNGTGKSTLLSLLLGTITPDRGTITVDGRIASLLELGAGFHPELTGRENIFLYGAILGMRLHEIKANLDRIIAFSELGDAIDNPIRTYSSGMIARLGFSTIIHVPADIILIDEVLAVGDSGFQEKCYAFLRDFKARGGTLVIVSHDLSALENLCDTVMVLELGKQVYYGAASNAILHYQHLIHSSS